MIQANELRIGNFVRYSDIYKISSIYDGYVDLESISGKSKLYKLKLEFIYPIQIDKSIFIINQFNFEDDCFHKEDLWFEFNELKDYNVRAVGFDKEIEFNYIHELQNFFYSYTKTELILND